MYNYIYITAYGIKMSKLLKMQIKIDGTVSLIYVHCNMW